MPPQHSGNTYHIAMLSSSSFEIGYQNLLHRKRFYCNPCRVLVSLANGIDQISGGGSMAQSSSKDPECARHRSFPFSICLGSSFGRGGTVSLAGKQTAIKDGAVAGN